MKPTAFGKTAFVLACLGVLGSELRERVFLVTGEAGIEKIEHIVMIMMENRSFDHYFGTYPGAEGLPRATRMATGRPVCRNYAGASA